MMEKYGVMVPPSLGKSDKEMKTALYLYIEAFMIGGPYEK